MGGTVLLLNTIGAKTGKTRTNPLVFALEGKGYIVAASAAGAPKHPGWYLNLVKTPHASIEIKGSHIPVHARLVTEGEERTSMYAKLDAVEGSRFEEYQDQASRTIPVVVLTPTD